jgi:hypothetical protein
MTLRNMLIFLAAAAIAIAVVTYFSAIKGEHTPAPATPPATTAPAPATPETAK